MAFGVLLHLLLCGMLHHPTVSYVQLYGFGAEPAVNGGDLPAGWHSFLSLLLVTPTWRQQQKH
jgi:hypothetical protein